MRRVLAGIGIIVIMVFLVTGGVFAATPTITITPAQIEQGDPFMIQIGNVKKVSDIKSVTFDGQKTGVCMYNSIPTTLVGVDIKKKPGVYIVVIKMKSGKTVKKPVIVAARQMVEKSFGIPEKLGGNTATAQKNVVKGLSKEAVTFGTIKTATRSLWTKPFIYPLPNPVVTDVYGYTRQTGQYTILHKGTDFKADEGTPVMAMNDGIVRMTTTGPTYGNTIVIDHGQGIVTMYLHLSAYKVKVGDTVQQGQVIGLSGQTGYATGPHLHLTVRINNIAIDPVKFMALFQ